MTHLFLSLSLSLSPPPPPPPQKKKKKKNVKICYFLPQKVQNCQNRLVIVLIIAMFLFSSFVCSFCVCVCVCVCVGGVMCLWCARACVRACVCFVFRERERERGGVFYASLRKFHCFCLFVLILSERKVTDRGMESDFFFCASF